MLKLGGYFLFVFRCKILTKMTVGQIIFKNFQQYLSCLCIFSIWAAAIFNEHFWNYFPFHFYFTFNHFRLSGTLSSVVIFLSRSILWMLYCNKTYLLWKLKVMKSLFLTGTAVFLLNWKMLFHLMKIHHWTQIILFL